MGHTMLMGTRFGDGAQTIGDGARAPAPPLPGYGPVQAYLYSEGESLACNDTLTYSEG